MEPQLDIHPKTSPHSKQDSAGRYILSFVWMILFTAAAFVIVGMKIFNPTLTFWSIFILAAIQVVIQLFTFMHLNFNGYRIPVIFIGLGLLIALVSVAGILFS